MANYAKQPKAPGKAPAAAPAAPPAGPEHDFAAAIEEALGGGVDALRLVDLVLQRWATIDPQGYALKDKLEVEGAIAKDNGDPIVTMSWGPLRGHMTPLGSIVTGLSFLIAAQTAETVSFLKRYFGKAKDQKMAQAILADLMPKYLAHMQAVLNEAGKGDHAAP